MYMYRSGLFNFKANALEYIGVANFELTRREVNRFTVGHSIATARHEASCFYYESAEAALRCVAYRPSLIPRWIHEDESDI